MLVCEAQVALRCHASPQVFVAVGDHEQRAQLSEAASNQYTAQVAFEPSVWRAALQTSIEPYATLQLRARVVGKCAEGDLHAAQLLEASDELTARFASGE